jgi:hypothetical protein
VCKWVCMEDTSRRCRCPLCSRSWRRRAPPAIKRSAFEFSLCLSRACLGKKIAFTHKWLKKPFLHRPLASPMSRRHTTVSPCTSRCSLEVCLSSSPRALQHLASTPNTRNTTCQEKHRSRKCTSALMAPRRVCQQRPH